MVGVSIDVAQLSGAGSRADQVLQLAPVPPGVHDRHGALVLQQNRGRVPQVLARLPVEEYLAGGLWAGALGSLTVSA
jgi:hypothetical protein